MKTSIALSLSLGLAIASGCGDSSPTGGGGSGAGTSQGGEAHGGSGQGGGGSSQGGSAQRGGGEAQGGAGGQGGGGLEAQAECLDGADCQLVNDCCRCEAIPESRTPPTCDAMDCDQLECAANGHDGTTIECQVGRCVAGYGCDSTLVTCDMQEPFCPSGETASVTPSFCWGPCVPTRECSTVAACQQCGPKEACVRVGGPNPSTHCVPIPPECGATPTCDCMGTSVCGNVTCDDSSGPLECQVP